MRTFEAFCSHALLLATTNSNDDSSSSSSSSILAIPTGCTNEANRASPLLRVSDG